MSRGASRERELFMRGGMTAWMDAWSDYAPGCGEGVNRIRCATEACRADGDQRPALPEGLRGQVTELLAGIAWAVARS